MQKALNITVVRSETERTTVFQYHHGNSSRELSNACVSIHILKQFVQHHWCQNTVGGYIFVEHQQF